VRFGPGAVGSGGCWLGSGGSARWTRRGGGSPQLCRSSSGHDAYSVGASGAGHEAEGVVDVEVIGWVCGCREDSGGTIMWGIDRQCCEARIGDLMELIVRELTAELWPALEDLFGTSGSVGRCWCMYWRIGSHYRGRSPDANREAFRKVVADGPPPGLLAFENDAAVGWCQLTSRDALPALDRTWRLRRVDDAPVWSISCFYIRKGYRRQGVTAALITAALEAARRAGAIAVEAYPLDAHLTTSASHTGYASTFERAGFTTVARHVPSRPIMRYEFNRSN
jgi:GNAT superfamily N-acetyltransferase